ncbi:MAG: nitrile hydratase subunit alpha [Chloroflexota bacterium]
MSGNHHGDHSEHESRLSIRARALESLLVEKGLSAPDMVDRVVSMYENDIGPQNGAKVVARAWVDPAFKRQLLNDATAAVETMGFSGGLLAVVENTPDVHNLVVCTLCSCYPGSLLGLPPTWYKSFAYRSRAVSEPRALLREFGLDLDESIELRVWDSSSELRYMVLPERPEGTEGFSEEQLAALVTRDSMIGVARATAPLVPA